MNVSGEGVVDGAQKMHLVNNSNGSTHPSVISPHSYKSNTKYKTHTNKSTNLMLEDSSSTIPPDIQASPTMTGTDYSTSGRWVRRLGYAERFMSQAHDYGCMTTVYSLWLESRIPLDYEHIKQASVIMFRKMPNLRLHLDHLDDDVWWREMTREVVDVEELATDDVEATIQLLVRRRYHMQEGPLWFARFVTLDPNEECVRDNNHNLKYKYVCIFGFHHNISDGSTNMKFCQVFLKVLNDLVQGKDIDMCQEGTFAMPLQDDLGNNLASIWFVMGIFLSRLYNIILTHGFPVWNFINYYRMPVEMEAGTHVLQQNELDENVTRKLISRCKMEGVTLNSAFTAAANLAMYKMMLDKNSNLDETNLCSQQAINMRRYWPKHLRQDGFGCHISLLDVIFPTKRSDLNAFWEYARGIHGILNYHLTETKRAIKLLPMSERLSIIIRHNYLMSKLGLPSASDNHYTVTNMGNLNSTFPGTGEEVEVSKVFRSVSCHFMPTLCQHTLQTFRGRFCYSLDYYAHKMTRETASQYAKEIIDTLTSSIHVPN
ncbi:uncharacterized protein LOC121878421 isoform X2 [Homarus americanus]|uniref:uncharacterized protein LOC121878421 isoform X2 n=1 Tax=Homarus americanus TaxID=6706 RepID=UPI001C451B71|nr:uncharacterized protein LOC121878421 isoform X2 [Homarus americanus]